MKTRFPVRRKAGYSYLFGSLHPDSAAAVIAAGGQPAAAVSTAIPAEPAEQENQDDDGPQVAAAEETIVVARHVIYLHTLAGHPALSHSIVLHACRFGYKVSLEPLPRSVHR